METNTPDLAQIITDLATPLAASLGLAIWGVDVVPAGRVVIRVFAESLDEYNRGQSIVSGREESPLLVEPSNVKPDTGESNSSQSERIAFGRNEGELVEGHDGPKQEGASQGSFSPDVQVQGDMSQGGITIDQCAELSRLLGLSLEVEDCVESAYVLEVSSPGLERLFFKAEQLKRAVGAKVEATLFRPLPEFPGRRKFIGMVSGVEGDMCTLTVAEPDSVEVSFPWSVVKKVKQIYVAPEKSLPGKSVKNTRQKKSAGKKNK